MALTCKICGSNLSHAFKALVLGKYDANYSFCQKCGFLCADNPHWLEESHSKAISSIDTGLVSRNVAISNKLAAILYFFIGERGNGRYIDLAGGYGLLTRLMRDYGFDFYWSDRYCQNLMALEFNYTSEMGTCSAVTAFEVLEHTENPTKFVEESLKLSQSDTLIFTTDLYEGKPPSPDNWWYYSFETGQHISFFQRQTLDKLANSLGLQLSSAGWIHVISKNKINELFLKAYTGRLLSLATYWVKKKLASRVISDRELLIKQLTLRTK